MFERNSWKSVATSIGNVIIILSVIAVIYKLRQTQSSLEASAHGERTDRNFNIVIWDQEHGASVIRRKAGLGEALTEQEKSILFTHYALMMRHFEDLHLQQSLGATDEETWAANLRGFSFFAQASSHTLFY